MITALHGILASSVIPIEADSNYITAFSALIINNGIVDYNRASLIDNGDGTWDSDGYFVATTKYKAANGSFFGLKIIGGESNIDFGLVEKYETRNVYGFSIKNGTLTTVYNGSSKGSAWAQHVVPGDWVIGKYTISGSTRRIIPYICTDGINLVEITPQTAIVVEDFSSTGNQFISLVGDEDSNIGYPQGSGLTLSA